jgi:hypothetical protein
MDCFASLAMTAYFIGCIFSQHREAMRLEGWGQWEWKTL